MISTEELNVLYTKTLAECKDLKDEVEIIKTLKGEHKDAIRRLYCNNLLYAISQGYTKYNQSNFGKDELVQTYLEMVKLLPKEYTYYHLTYYFFKQENKKCLSMLEEYMRLLYEEVKDEIKKPDDFINESIFIDMFFEPFKQAFSLLRVIYTLC